MTIYTPTAQITVNETTGNWIAAGRAQVQSAKAWLFPRGIDLDATGPELLAQIRRELNRAGQWSCDEDGNLTYEACAVTGY